MTTKWTDPARGGCGVTASELFNVVLVYEDQFCAQRGLAFYQNLMGELGIACEFNLSAWKSAVLALARLDELTREQATAADLVIVCSRGSSAPADQIQSWHQRCADLKDGNDCALVVLDAEAGENSRAGRPDQFISNPAHRRGTAGSPAATGCARADSRAWFAPRQAARAWQPRQACSTSATACVGT